MKNAFRLSTALVACLLFAAADARALTLSGVVRNEAGTGLSNVDIDLIDVCTSNSVFLVNDRTAADGSYSITVNAGTYDVRYTPPAGSTVAALETQDVVINSNTNLGTTVLHPGRLVSGRLTLPAGGAASGVELRFLDPVTGDKVYFTKDLTSATGDWSVRVLPGTYDLDFRPPPTLTYADGLRTHLVVGTSDVTGLADTLKTGVNVFGTVTDSRKVAIQYANLSFYDVCTGQKVQASHHTTDATGKFSVYVPASNYNIYINPPHCSTTLGSVRMADTRLDRTTDLKTTVLPDALAVSGRLLDSAGQPVIDVHVKFYTANNNSRQAAPHDRTDAQGRFTAYVPADTYNINFEPPDGRDLVVGRIENVVVSSAVALGDITLAAGLPVNGRLVNAASQGVLNANINAVDSATRATVRLANDSTAADGTFRVVVPAGTYDFQYSPPACTGMAPSDQKSVAVSGSTTLPVLTLVAGVHARGNVTDDHAAPVNLVDVRFYVPGTRTRYYTPNNNSDALGNYDVFVQPGSYDIDYLPPAGAPLRPVRRANVTVLADTTLPVTVLGHGPLVTGTVHAQNGGTAVVNALVDFYAAAASVPLWVAHNDTALDGSYSVAVDAGTWDVLFTPPAGTGLAPRWRRSVAVAADTALGDTLLLPLTVPTVSSIAPATGTSAGGTNVTISGTGFQPDAIVKLGGRTTGTVTVVSSTQITATTAARPPGKVDVLVLNPGNQAGSRASAFTYTEPVAAPRLTVKRSGNDILLQWTTTGQAQYTVFRSSNATLFDDTTVRATTGALAFTDAGAARTGTIQYYVVE